MNKQDLVREQLLQWLQSVEAGARLQSERELAVQLGVSRSTIRIAVDNLVNDGVLTRVHGSGVYVNRTVAAPKSKIAIVHFSDYGPMRSPFHMAVLQKAEMEIRRVGCDVILAPIQLEGDAWPDLQDADAVLAMSRINPASLPDQMPLVSLFDPTYPLANVTQVLTDDYLHGRMAAQYLLGLGHRHIAFIAVVDTKEFLWARERYRGICDMAAEAGANEPALINMNYAEPINIDLAKCVADTGVSAIICANDYTAMGMISALHSIGLDVPGNISVMGFDDVPNAAIFYPPLTTVMQPVDEAVATAVAELKQMLTAGGRGATRRITLPSQLVVRESCAPYKERNAVDACAAL